MHCIDVRKRKNILNPLSHMCCYMLQPKRRTSLYFAALALLSCLFTRFLQHSATYSTLHDLKVLAISVVFVFVNNILTFFFSVSLEYNVACNTTCNARSTHTSKSDFSRSHQQRQWCGTSGSGAPTFGFFKNTY